MQDQNTAKNQTSSGRNKKAKRNTSRKAKKMDKENNAVSQRKTAAESKRMKGLKTRKQNVVRVINSRDGKLAPSKAESLLHVSDGISSIHNITSNNSFCAKSTLFARSLTLTD